MLNIDLHCHSNVSDGVLTPTQLVERAHRRGVMVLALTDHDDVAGLDEASRVAAEKNITFINGVEISVTWRGRTIHILGLNVDPDYKPLFDGLTSIRDGRTQRARTIADELEKVGVEGSFEGAFAYVGERGLIGRTHFARFLVEKGYAKDMKAVFKKYLVKGKPGYAHHEWIQLSGAIDWITGSGGRAVIAHPARYNLGKNVLNDLFDEFYALGGTGIEVISASHTREQVEIFADYARIRGFLVSCGSDFHGPDESFYDLGQLPDLPPGCVPVWHDWKIPAACLT
ncbi:MAG: PHP domain-containing protein [Nitrosomonas sp.]|nr:PHP domain-containing protein [Nitrosomonas sp.]